MNFSGDKTQAVTKEDILGDKWQFVPQCLHYDDSQLKLGWLAQSCPGFMGVHRDESAPFLSFAFLIIKHRPTGIGCMCVDVSLCFQDCTLLLLLAKNNS